MTSMDEEPRFPAGCKYLWAYFPYWSLRSGAGSENYSCLFFFSFSLEYSRLSFALRINKKRKPPKQMIQVERRQPRLWNRVTSESITVLMCHSQTALWPQFLHLYWRCWFLGYKTTVRSWCHVFSSDWPMSLWKKHWHHTWKFSVVLLATSLDYLLSFTRY